MIERTVHCPACDQQILADSELRESLLERGCPFCTADLDSEHITEPGSVPHGETETESTNR